MISNHVLPNGVWPVMLTPFLDDAQRSIDWASLDELVSWYLDAGVSGLFACCLSSESYHLSDQEKVELASRIINRVDGRVPVVVGVMGQTTRADRIKQIHACHDLGAAAIILNIAEWVTAVEMEDTLIDRLQALVSEVPSIDFGIYECPLPYHRLLTPDAVARIAQTQRFTFYKETSESPDILAAKVKSARGTRLHIYNADTTLLSKSLELGAAGFSGLEANFCPELCVWLCNNANNHPLADSVQRLMTQAHTGVVHIKYPACAKVFLGRLGLSLGDACRSHEDTLDSSDMRRLAEFRTRIDKTTQSLIPPSHDHGGGDAAPSTKNTMTTGTA